MFVFTLLRLISRPPIPTSFDNLAKTVSQISNLNSSTVLTYAIDYFLDFLLRHPSFKAHELSWEFLIIPSLEVRFYVTFRFLSHVGKCYSRENKSKSPIHMRKYLFDVSFGLQRNWIWKEQVQSRKRSDPGIQGAPWKYHIDRWYIR